MRLLVCGDRNWTDFDRLRDVLDNWPWRISLLIEGGARGADRLSRQWAELRHVGFVEYPAQWTRFGAAAGPIRNAEMLADASPDAVLAFHNSLATSRGTLDMLRRAHRASVPCCLATGTDISAWPPEQFESADPRSGE